MPQEGGKEEQSGIRHLSEFVPNFHNFLYKLQDIHFNFHNPSANYQNKLVATQFD